MHRSRWNETQKKRQKACITIATGHLHTALHYHPKAIDCKCSSSCGGGQKCEKDCKCNCATGACKDKSGGCCGK
ncbi:hypothetical protein AND_010046 [Anopheles darlingi]|uniref:Metallothionein n=1 Tax=Anopheles darlingi TaxID=43151 RepID=W5J6B2_ANODA|nr:hypothetical protein AND_010046 [Anopheles darlingi]